MPLFITPMKKAPMTTPITLPTPPEAETPPMKQAAMTSSSNELPALGVAEFRRAATMSPARPGEHAHVDEGEERQALGADARELRGEPVAAHRIDAPADRHARRHERVEQDQHAHDDEHVGQALVAGEQIAEAEDQDREDRVLADEQREGLGLHRLGVVAHPAARAEEDQQRGADDADQHRQPEELVLSVAPP